MAEAKGIPQPFTIAGIEVPVRGGFRFDQARKIFDAARDAIAAAPKENPTDTLFAYLTSQGIQSAEQVKFLRNALETPLARRKNPFTEADHAIVSSLIDIIGRLNMPQRLPPESPPQGPLPIRGNTRRLPRYKPQK